MAQPRNWQPYAPNTPGSFHEGLRLIERLLRPLPLPSDAIPITGEGLPTKLRDFVRQAWSILEPITKLEWGYSHDAICEHLEAVTNEQIKDLVITIMPRSLKSLLCSVLWPAWEWGPRGMPYTRWLTTSYAEGLAIDHAVKTRQLLRSGWYQIRWGQLFHFVGDVNQKTQYENDKTGYRIATGVGGGATGKGGDRLLCDDPHKLDLVGKVIKHETLEERNSTVNWWQVTMATRRNDPKRSARVVIQQRVHTEDVAGACIESGDYVHLNLPNEYDPKHTCVTYLNDGTKFWEDWRKEPGELLHENRFGRKETVEAKKMGAANYEAVFQQNPVPSGGGMIKLGWFQRYRVLPDKKFWQRVVISLDTAQKASQLNDPWAFTVWIETKDGHYLAEVVRAWFEFPEGKRQAVSLYEKWRPHAFVIEDKGHGTALLQEMKHGDLKAKKIPVRATDPLTDKVTRMSVESPVIEAGLAYLPYEAEWLGAYELEIKGFPTGVRHDDQVDSTSQYFKYVREHPFAAVIQLPFRA